MITRVTLLRYWYLLFTCLRRIEKYSDQHVCMSVCLSVFLLAYVENHTSNLH